MKKLIFLFLFAVTLLLSPVFFTTTAFADETITDIAPTRIQNSDTYYSYSADTKTLTIAGVGAVPNFSNSSGSSTSQPWFSWRSDGTIEHIYVSEGITSLGNYCLYGVAVNDISLPTTLEIIGSSAIASANISNGIILPENLTTISNNAFYYTNGIENLLIPSTVKSIGVSAFENCYSLKTVEFESLASSVTIGRRAFFKCALLETITLPKGAALQSYSVGFYQASAGSVYENTTMRVFKNSPAYNYAVKNYVNYELIEKTPIFEGDCINCEFTDSDLDDTIKFSFTPVISTSYQFFSVGDIDIACQLKNGDTVLCDNDDVSAMDTDFYISYYLVAGIEYTFCVTTNHFSGVFEVNLMPVNVTELSCSVSNIEFSAGERLVGKYDVLSKLADAKLDFTFDTGYEGSVTVGDGAYRNYCTVEYSDNQYSTLWYCGEHTAYIGIGGASVPVSVMVNHQYESEIVAPTYTEKGYTICSCIGCDDTYKCDYTASLGILVRGRAVLMESPDGSHSHNYTLSDIDVFVDSVNKAKTGIDGEFEFWVDSDSSNLSLVGIVALPRTISLNAVDGVVDLGDIPLVNFDYCTDGYINAKDYAVFRSIFGHYGVGIYDIVDSVDYNHDGILNDNDWFGAGADSFLDFGKIDSSIY